MPNTTPKAPAGSRGPQRRSASSTIALMKIACMRIATTPSPCAMYALWISMLRNKGSGATVGNTLAVGWLPTAAHGRVK